VLSGADVAAGAADRKAGPPLLEATQLTGYPEGQLPTSERDQGVCGSPKQESQEEKLHHGCAQAENVAVEHP
jgi:hypothetical protein